MRRAVDAECPALGAWTAWCHGAPAAIQLPTGSWVDCDRGAEQGDPLGPVYCGLVLLEAARSACAVVRSQGGWAWDAWFMDDAQVVVEPQFAAVFVAEFDRILASVGGSRVAGAELKSTARLCGSREAIEQVDPTWTCGVAETCRILSGPAKKVLGVGIDGLDVEEQFARAIAKTRATCQALRSVSDPAVELALLRLCSGVCKIQHLLRAVGPELPLAQILEFDECIEDALSETLGGAVRGDALDRATCGASQGGLGIRRAVEIRHLAFISSRVDARPLAEEVASGLPEDLSADMFSHWDADVTGASAAWLEELPAGSAPLARQLLSDGAEAAQRRASQLLGHLPDGAKADPPSTRDLVQAALVTPVGLADAEHPDRPPPPGCRRS